MRATTNTEITITAMTAPFRPEFCFPFSTVDELVSLLSAALAIPGGAGRDDQEFPPTLMKR